MRIDRISTGAILLNASESTYKIGLMAPRGSPVLIFFVIVGRFCFSTDSHGQPPPAPVHASPPVYKAKDGSVLTEDALIKIFAEHRLWAGSGGEKGRKANLDGADLSGLNFLDLEPRAEHGNDGLPPFSLPRVNFRGTILRKCSLALIDLHGSDFTGADLEEANLVGANLDNTDLSSANLSRATIKIGWLRRAKLSETNLTDTTFSVSDLTRVHYDPRPKSLPKIYSFVGAKGLNKLQFDLSEAGLVELRTALRDAGTRDQERQVNYSIQHERAKHLRKSGRKSEAWFQYVFFDLTCKYGMEPGRPLRILLGLIPIFAISYLVAILYRRRFKRSGIWAVRIKNAVNKPERKTRAVAVEIQQWATLTWWRKVVAAFHAARVALFFSLVSAFSVGFHEINVGLWISSLQSREHAFRGTGWVRCVAGFQSLLSVYLLALWVLTYFGRPFE